jgi:ribosome recycling factor
MADLAQVWSDVDTDMQLAVESFKEEAQKMRAGSVNMDAIKNIQVTAYGTTMPLYQVATISAPSAATAVITPWDKGTIKAVADAVQADMKRSYAICEGRCHLSEFPPLTQEKKRIHESS